MTGRHTGWLGPMPPYADLPVWDHNFDNVGVRLVNAGWNALFTRELIDFSFRELARDFGAAPQTLYYYFPSVTALGGELAFRAMLTLIRDVNVGVPPKCPTELGPRKALCRQVLTSYLAFAAKRPRHYLLIFSPRYASQYEFPQLAHARSHLLEILKALVGFEVERDLTDAEAHAFFSLLHGSAALVAAGHPPATAQLFRMLDAFVDDLRTQDAQATSTTSTPAPVPSATPSVIQGPVAGPTDSTQPDAPAPEPAAVDDS